MVDPAQGSPFDEDRGFLRTFTEAGDLALTTIEKLHKVRLPWWHVWRAADKAGATTPKHPVIFECVGVPGIIESIRPEERRRATRLTPRTFVG